MEEDKLRSFIRENRESFDTEKTPSRVWDRVQGDLGSGPKRDSISLRNMWLILAGVVGLFTIITFVGIQSFQSEEPVQEQQFAIEADEYQQLKKHYEPLLQKKEQTFVSQVNAPAVIDELGELDAGFRELQSDFLNSEAGNKEIMMKLMKENYELRIQILEMAMTKLKVEAETSQEFTKEKNNEY